MKFFLWLILTASSCAVVASQQDTQHSQSNSKELSGEELFSIVLKNSDHPLKNEPLCQPPPFDIETYTLADKLTLLLAQGHYRDSYAELNSSCVITKFEQPSGDLVDVWDCKITVVKIDEDIEFFSSGTIVLSISISEKKMLEGSLRCL